LQHAGDNQRPAKCSARRLLLVVPRIAAVRPRDAVPLPQRTHWDLDRPGSSSRSAHKINCETGSANSMRRRSRIPDSIPNFPVMLFREFRRQMAEFSWFAACNSIYQKDETEDFPVFSRVAGNLREDSSQMTTCSAT